MNQREVFVAALHQADPVARRAFLREACADERLRQEIESMLREHEELDDFLESPAPTPNAWVEPGDAAGIIGTMIGPYKLLEQVGEGGMGTVYMANQVTPVRRRVALKVIKPGMDSRQVLARFEAERQALAMMDHPNIARVLDAGATDSGRPYFVMELVKGRPITDYCDAEQLSVAERLELFVLVCRAVQHAHQKGVIHRDLKPSNVLVTVIDGAAVPKVIDFGVAKATGQTLTDRTLFTGFAQLVGTPLYMSPEQAQFSGVDVDTRSDIYSLGVLLYELLTGSTPIDRDTLGQAAFDEVRRIIREQEPPTPSARLHTLGDALTAVSSRRRAEPRALGRSMRGELDWIVMKALEKDRTRRYETASGFAGDVERYLEGDPVEAGPPSAAYRLRKLAGKHRAAMATAAAFTMLLAAAVGLSTMMAVRATRAERRVTAALTVADTQRRLAEERSRLARQAVDEMYSQVADEWLQYAPQKRGVELRFIEKALAYYRRFAAERSDDPEARQALALALERVGRIHGSLGHAKEADEAFRHSLAIQEDLVKRSPADPGYRKYLAFLLRAGGEQEMRRALAIQEGLVAEFPADCDLRIDFAHYCALLGLDLKGQGRDSEAQQIHRLALDRLEEVAASSPGAAARSDFRGVLADELHHFGDALYPTDRQAAERAYRRSITLYEALGAEAASDPRAESGPVRHSTEFAIGGFSHRYSQNFMGLAGARLGLGVLLKEAGKAGDAEPCLRQALDYYEHRVAQFPDVSTWTDFLRKCSENLGDLLQETGRIEEAASIYRRVGGVLREVAEAAEKSAAAEPANPKLRLTATVRLIQRAWFLSNASAPQLRDPAGAVTSAKRSVELSPHAGGAWNALGVAQYRSKDWKAAIEALEKSMDLWAGGKESFNTFFLAMAYWQLGNREAARRWYDRGVGWMDRNLPRDDQLRRFRDEAAQLLGKLELPGDVLTRP